MSDIQLRSRSRLGRCGAILSGLLLSGCQQEKVCDAEACADRCGVDEALLEVEEGGVVLTRVEAAYLQSAIDAVRVGVVEIGEGVVLCRGTSTCEEDVGTAFAGTVEPGRYFLSIQVEAPSVGTWGLEVLLACRGSKSEPLEVRKHLDLPAGEMPTAWTAFALEVTPLPRQERSCEWSVWETGRPQSDPRWAGGFQWPLAKI